MKKIAMLFPYAPSYREAIYVLMDRNFQVDWYFAGNAQRKLRLLDYAKLKSCDLSMQEKHLGCFTWYSGIIDLDFSQYDAIIIAGVIRCFSEWRLIHKYAGKPNGPKVYLWTHGWYGKESFIQTIIKKIFFKQVDGFFLYGDYARNLMIEQGFDPKKLFVIKNSLDYEKQLNLRKMMTPKNLYREYFNNDNPNIIFIGRLTPVKRLDQLIKAIKNLKDIGYLCNLIFVGDGSERSTLQALVNSLELQECVWFYGECFNENTNAELIYNSDLCVAPGNVGLTAMHALMFGCPVITHDDFKWQMPEFEAIKPNVTGDFFKRGDVVSLANTIKTCLERHKNGREDIRRACYAEIDTYWNPNYQLNLIREVLDLEQ